MRQSRLHKFKKRKVGILIIAQLVAIYYLGVYGLFEFTSPTNAAFNDIERLTLSLKAADEFEPPDDGEWDKSSLKFNGQTSHCQEGTISAVIQNGQGSRDMKGPVTYEVYWAAEGNPKPDKGGTKVASGQVPPLGSGETYEMFYTPTKPGNYMFRAEQRPGHPGKGELWSESIKFEQNCLPQQADTTESKKLEKQNKARQEQTVEQDQKEKDNQQKPIEQKDDKNTEEQAAKENSVKSSVTSDSERSSIKEFNKKEEKGTDRLNENND